MGKSNERKNPLPQIPREFFLETLAATGDVEAAAKAGGRTLRCFYQWRLADAEFLEEWEQAEREGTALLAREAQRRAIEGTRKYLYHMGKPVFVTNEAGQLVHAYELNYSDTLLLALLNARDPERYCPRVRAARIQRKWDKEDGKAGQGATVPAQTVVDLLVAAAAKKAAEPEQAPPATPDAASAS